MVRAIFGEIEKEQPATAQVQQILDQVNGQIKEHAAGLKQSGEFSHLQALTYRRQKNSGCVCEEIVFFIKARTDDGKFVHVMASFNVKFGEETPMNEPNLRNVEYDKTQTEPINAN